MLGLQACMHTWPSQAFFLLSVGCASWHWGHCFLGCFGLIFYFCFDIYTEESPLGAVWMDMGIGSPARACVPSQDHIPEEDFLLRQDPSSANDQEWGVVNLSCWDFGSFDPGRVLSMCWHLWVNVHNSPVMPGNCFTAGVSLPLLLQPTPCSVHAHQLWVSVPSTKTSISEGGKMH